MKFRGLFRGSDRKPNTKSLLSGDVLNPSRGDEDEDRDEVEYVEQEKSRVVTGEDPLDWLEL